MTVLRIGNLANLTINLASRTQPLSLVNSDMTAPRGPGTDMDNGGDGTAAWGVPSGVLRRRNCGKKILYVW